MRHARHVPAGSASAPSRSQERVSLVMGVPRRGAASGVAVTTAQARQSKGGASALPLVAAQNAPAPCLCRSRSCDLTVGRKIAWTQAYGRALCSRLHTATDSRCRRCPFGAPTPGACRAGNCYDVWHGSAQQSRPTAAARSSSEPRQVPSLKSRSAGAGRLRRSRRCLRSSTSTRKRSRRCVDGHRTCSIHRTGGNAVGVLRARGRGHHAVPLLRLCRPDPRHPRRRPDRPLPGRAFRVRSHGPACRGAADLAHRRRGRSTADDGTRVIPRRRLRRRVRSQSRRAPSALGRVALCRGRCPRPPRRQAHVGAAGSAPASSPTSRLQATPGPMIGLPAGIDTCQAQAGAQDVGLMFDRMTRGDK